MTEPAVMSVIILNQQAFTEPVIVLINKPISDSLEHLNCGRIVGISHEHKLLYYIIARISQMQL